MKKLILITMMASMSSIGAKDITEFEFGSDFTQNFDENAVHLGKGDQNDKSFDSGYYNAFVAASGASPANSADTYQYGSGGCIYETVDTGAFFYVNVFLPDGHTIQGFRHYYYDGSASSSTVTLFKMDGAGGNTSLGVVTSVGDTGFGSSYELLTDGNHVVNNSNGAYMLRFSGNEVGTNQRMCGVRFQMYNL